MSDQKRKDVTPEVTPEVTPLDSPLSGGEQNNGKVGDRDHNSSTDQKSDSFEQR